MRGAHVSLTDTGATEALSVPVTPDRAGSADSGTSTLLWDNEETLDLRLPPEFTALRAVLPGQAASPHDGDPLDGIHTWGPTPTPAGPFELVPVRLDRDLPLIHGWMNDPEVAEFWELAGPQDRTERHLRAQLDGGGRSVPCLGMLDGTAMSYWEIYRADLDPLARRYRARPHDTGIHLLIGDAAHRGRGLGSALLTAVAELVMERRRACTRIVAEPDMRNTPSVTAFRKAGFRCRAEVELPGKRAALMIRDRVRPEP
ncbi:GNAT family N-acetyltransferase [Streptomyces bauhiniae]|uniref:Lysine N-acyltransferase MbtK n=1 Tax=Streptomyces bauhiniae TaxID=2340725 RepID=A0A7K3QRZ9_9ACTN|nr:acetyltransferase [Streptomyces bauhiniae]